jgi:hypothetical protein
MGLIQSLGLSAVSGDPNDLPVGKYNGIVSKSEYVLVKEKDKVSHVVTYQVTEGERKGGTKQVWYDLFTQIKDENGNFPEKVEDIRKGEPAMSEAQKDWYKKAILDVTGCTKEEADVMEPEGWLNKPVTFGVSERNGYKNVSFVEPRRTVSTEAVQGLTGISFGGAPASPEGMPSF